MSSKLDPDRVRFAGPLAPFASGLREELAALGYARTSAAIQLQFAAHLSRWLDGVGMGPGDLSGPVIDRFLAERRSGYTSHYSRRGLSPILGYLRRVGVAPVALPVAEVSGADVLLGEFACYLIGRRALTAPVADAYCHWVRPFTEEVLCPNGVDRLGELSAGQVNRFWPRGCRGCPASARR